MKEQKRYVHIYTGEGKGKTTAAIGLAVRAAGAGWRVLLAQFLKKGRFSEIRALEAIRGITVKQFGSGAFVRGKPSVRDIARARAGLAEIEQDMLSGEYDLVILDEINIAVYYGLISVDDMAQFLAKRPEKVEIVLTGRHAPGQLVDLADVVTEMKMVRHYFEKGVTARTGIEK